jgi:glycyl-tRNA synthetase beta subunit
VLAEQSHNPYRALTGCRELAGWVNRPDWPRTLDAYARCVRITRAEPEIYPLDPARLSPSEALELYLAAGKATTDLDGTSSVDAFLQAFQGVIPAITAFFDHVLVMDADLMVRENRLALLQYVATLAKGRADLSKLTGF